MSKAKDVLNNLEEKSPGMEVRGAMEKVIVAAQKAIDAADSVGDELAKKLSLGVKRSAKDAVHSWATKHK